MLSSLSSTYPCRRTLEHPADRDRAKQHAALVARRQRDALEAAALVAETMDIVPPETLAVQTAASQQQEHLQQEVAAQTARIYLTDDPDEAAAIRAQIAAIRAQHAASIAAPQIAANTTTLEPTDLPELEWFDQEPEKYNTRSAKRQRDRTHVDRGVADAARN